MTLQNKFIVFFLGVMFLGAWSGQAILEFGFWGLVLVWLTDSYKNWKREPTLGLRAFGLRSCGVGWLFFAYFVLACLGYVFNAVPEATPFKFLPRFSTLLQIYVLMWVMERLTLSDRGILKFLSWALLIPAVHGILNWFFISRYIPIYRSEGLLKSSIQHALIGGYYVVLFGVVYFKNFFNLEKSKRFSYGIVFLALTLNILTTRTRTAILAAALAMGFFVLLQLPRKMRWVMFFLGVVTAGALWFSPAKEIVLRKNSDHCRQQLYRIHFNMIKEKPLLGIGYLDNLRSLKEHWPVEEVGVCTQERNTGVHAHNQYVNVAATTGLLALVVFLGFYFYFFWLNWQLYNNALSPHLKLQASMALTLQFYFLTIGMAEVPFEYAKMRWLILIVWGWVKIESDLIKTQSPSPKDFSHS